MKLFDEQLFCILYPTLYEISEEFDELMPAEVYMEALDYCQTLRKVKRPDLMKDDLMEMLAEKYNNFIFNGKTKQRKEQDVDRTVFLVQITSLYILAALNKQTGIDDEYCRFLAEMTYEHELRERFTSQVRITEDEEELKGKRVEIVNLMIQEDTENPDAILDEIVNCTLQYKDEIIENLLTVLTDINDQNDHRYDNYIIKLRSALKKRVKNQNGPRSLVKYGKGSTHNDHSKYIGFSYADDEDEKLLE